MHSISILARLMFLISVMLTLASSKVFSNVYNVQNFLRNDGWNYIGRMYLNSGKVTLSLQLQIRIKGEKDTQFLLEVVAVPNSLWKEEIQKKCLLSSYTPEILALKAEKQILLPLTLTKSSGYRAITTKLSDLPEKTLYHFVLRDCSQSTVKEIADRTMKVAFQLDVRNNQQHVAAHEQSYNYVLPFIILLEGLLIVLLQRDKQQDGDNWTKYLLKISLWVAMGSLACKYIGHLIYSFTGHNYEFFQILYLLIHSASDSIILFLLTLLSFGWTVTFYNHESMNFNIPLGCMCSFLYMILTVMNKIPEGQDKYHMFDTIPAYFMIFFRMAVFTVFIYGVIRSIALTPKAELKIRNYFIHLAVLGTLYLIFVPIAFMLIELVQQEKREQIMMYGLQVGRLLLLGWLAFLSGWKSSSYRKVLDISFMEKDQKYY